MQESPDGLTKTHNCNIDLGCDILFRKLELESRGASVQINLCTTYNTRAISPGTLCTSRSLALVFIFFFKLFCLNDIHWGGTWYDFQMEIYPTFLSSFSCQNERMSEKERKKKCKICLNIVRY